MHVQIWRNQLEIQKLLSTKKTHLFYSNLVYQTSPQTAFKKKEKGHCKLYFAYLQCRAIWRAIWLRYCTQLNNEKSIVGHGTKFGISINISHNIVQFDLKWRKTRALLNEALSKFGISSNISHISIIVNLVVSSFLCTSITFLYHICPTFIK